MMRKTVRLIPLARTFPEASSDGLWHTALGELVSSLLHLCLSIFWRRGGVLWAWGKAIPPLCLLAVPKLQLRGFRQHCAMAKQGVRDPLWRET